MRGLSVLAIFITIAPAFADVDAFNTPSGNIECSAGIGDGIPADIYCRIFDHSGPPSIPRLAQCNGAPGYEFSMRDSQMQSGWTIGYTPRQRREIRWSR